MEENTAVLRAKVRVSMVTRVIDEHGNAVQEQVKLQAVYGKDGTANAEWSKWTPSASFDISISNTEAFGKLANGHEFYVDFTPAPKEGE